jgi:hypothetical protein
MDLVTGWMAGSSLLQSPRVQNLISRLGHAPVARKRPHHVRASTPSDSLGRAGFRDADHYRATLAAAHRMRNQERATSASEASTVGDNREMPRLMRAALDYEARSKASPGGVAARRRREKAQVRNSTVEGRLPEPSWGRFAANGAVGSLELGAGFAMGNLKAGMQFAKGLAGAVMHPVRAAAGVGHAFAHPLETAEKFARWGVERGDPMQDALDRGDMLALGDGWGQVSGTILANAAVGKVAEAAAARATAIGGAAGVSAAGEETAIGGAAGVSTAGEETAIGGPAGVSAAGEETAIGGAAGVSAAGEETAIGGAAGVSAAGEVTAIGGAAGVSAAGETTAIGAAGVSAAGETTALAGGVSARTAWLTGRAPSLGGAARGSAMVERAAIAARSAMAGRTATAGRTVTAGPTEIAGRVAIAGRAASAGRAAIAGHTASAAERTFFPVEAAPPAATPEVEAAPIDPPGPSLESPQAAVVERAPLPSAAPMRRMGPTVPGVTSLEMLRRRLPVDPLPGSILDVTAY